MFTLASVNCFCHRKHSWRCPKVWLKTSGFVATSVVGRLPAKTVQLLLLQPWSETISLKYPVGWWNTVSNCGPSLHACNSTSKLAAASTFTAKHWATNYSLSCLPANPQLSGDAGAPCNCPHSRFNSMQPFSVVEQAHVRLWLLHLKVPSQFDSCYSVLQFCSCSMKQL